MSETDTSEKGLESLIMGHLTGMDLSASRSGGLTKGTVS